MKQLIILFLLPLKVFSQSNDALVQQRIKAVENSLAPSVIYGDTVPKLNIEKRMKETGVQGLSIAVITNYKMEWAKGYGWADVEEKRKVTTNTRFQAASISKSINSLGVLKLVEMGKLDPEADINNYLSSWKFPYDSISNNKKISVYNLLSHTAGLDIHGFPGYKRSNTFPSVQNILDGKPPANTKAVRSLFEPGKRFKYSGGGTTISQLVLTNITNNDYAQWMQKNVLQPIGMTNSSYQQPPIDTSNLATGYYYGNGKPVSGKYHIYPEQAAAGLWTTPTDLAKYIIECQLALEGKSKKVLSQAMMKKRMTPYIDSAAALGVFIEKRGDQAFFNHNGGNEAFLCTSYGSMQGGNGVVIMINGDNFAVISELLNSVATVYNWNGFYKPSFKKTVTLSKDTLTQYVGKFLMQKDTLAILFCGDNLCIQQNGEPKPGFQLLFADASNFSVREVPNAAFTIIRNAAGKVEALQLKQGPANIRIPKIEF